MFKKLIWSPDEEKQEHRYKTIPIRRTDKDKNAIKSKQDIANEIDSILNDFGNDLIGYKMFNELDGDYFLTLKVKAE